MIAIKDMEMPKSCGECPRTTICSTYLNQYINCPSTRYSYGQNKRPNDCPLVEIITCKDCSNYGVTNGDMLMAIFPNGEFRQTSRYNIVFDGAIYEVDWWNAPYKGSEGKA